MAHIIQLVLESFMGYLGVKGRNKSWGDYEKDRQCDETKKAGQARVDWVRNMNAGFAKIVEKVRTER